MKQIITAKLKLTTTPGQFAALRQTQLAYRDALNAVSRYAFSCGKTSNVTRLHKGMYTELRTRYHLPSQLACSVERQVAATYKGLWTKLLKNVEHRRAKITKKRFKGLDQPPHSSSPTVQYTYERDYTFQCDSRVSCRPPEWAHQSPLPGLRQTPRAHSAGSHHRGRQTVV
jgi:hypothetical protein